MGGGMISKQIGKLYKRGGKKGRQIWKRKKKRRKGEKEEEKKDKRPKREVWWAKKGKWKAR